MAGLLQTFGLAWQFAAVVQGPRVVPAVFLKLQAPLLGTTGQEAEFAPRVGQVVAVVV